jgi:hypothetical protein
MMPVMMCSQRTKNRHHPASNGVSAEQADQNDDDDQENDACRERLVQALKKGCDGIAPPLQMPRIR